MYEAVSSAFNKWRELLSKDEVVVEEIYWRIILGCLSYICILSRRDMHHIESVCVGIRTGLSGAERGRLLMCVH